MTKSDESQESLPSPLDTDTPSPEAGGASGISPPARLGKSTTSCTPAPERKAGDVFPAPRVSLPEVVGMAAVVRSVQKAWDKENALLEAKETKFFSKDGKVKDEREVEALGIQLKAAQAIHEVSGVIMGRPREDLRSRHDPQTINVTVLFGISPPGEPVEAVTVEGEVVGES